MNAHLSSTAIGETVETDVKYLVVDVVRVAAVSFSMCLYQ
jgi:hypothetical protein